MTARLRAGALVACLSTALPLLLSAPAAAATPPAEIVYVLDRDGDGAGAIVVRDLTSRTVRTVVPEGDALVEAPALSRDGRSIAFSTDAGSSTGSQGIAVVGIDGRGLRRITEPPAETEHTFTFDTDPTWGADGSVVFARVVEDDRGDSIRGSLQRVAGNGGAATAVRGTGNAISPDFDATGTQLAYVGLNPTNDGSGAGSILGLDVTAATPAPRGLGGFGFDPAWSPDGRTVAWARFGNGVPDGIVSRRVDQADAPVVTLVPGTGSLVTFATFAPFWLPDGRSLAYSRVDLRDPRADVDLFAVDSAGRRSGPFIAGTPDEVYGAARPRALEAVVARAASTYVPVEPVRLLDTRSESATGTVTAGRVGPGGTVRLQVAGQRTSAGVVPADVSAVVLNVTVTGVSASTDVRVYPSGSGVPEVSNVNATRGQTVPNLVTVPVGRDGAVVLRNQAGQVHLIADLAGFYVPGARGAGFAPLDPRRVLDTRPGTTVGVPQAGRVGAGRVVPLKVTGRVPVAGGGTVTVPDTATAVILNVTGTGATRSTDVRAYPHGSRAVPEVSNLNLTAGLTAPNLVVVRVGEGGLVDLRNQSGEVHLVADLAGYFGGDGSAQLVPAGPARFLDTRDGTGAAPIATTAGGFADVAVAGSRGVAGGAVAAVLNLTVTGASASTDVRAYPATAGTVPLVSNVNVTRGVTRANAAVVKTGSNGEVRVRNASGSVQLIGDLAGYFVPAP